jgi:hypothetical protein
VRKKENVKAPSVAEPERQSAGTHWGRWALTAFLVFHLVAITSWCLPLNSVLNDRWKQAIRPYMLWTGLFAAWDMFAPNPATLNSYIDAQITFRDGTAKTWSVPRMHEIGYVDRYFKERYRKFSTEYLRMDSYNIMWPDAARYIARVNSTPGNPAVAVTLIRSWSEINPPSPTGQYVPSPWNHFPFFTYQVQPGDLQ